MELRSIVRVLPTSRSAPGKLSHFLSNSLALTHSFTLTGCSGLFGASPVNLTLLNVNIVASDSPFLARTSPLTLINVTFNQSFGE